MGVSRRVLAIKTLKELSDLDGYLWFGCYDCRSSEFVSALNMIGNKEPGMMLDGLNVTCPKCKRALKCVPMITPYDWVLAKLIQRELPF